MTIRSRGGTISAKSRIAAWAVSIVTLMAVATITTGISISPAEGSQSARASAEPASYSIFGSATPSGQPDSETRAVELGVRFSSSTSGWITAVRYYRASEALSSSRGTIWSSDGSILARADFPKASGIGWQTTQLANPVKIESGRTYVASYFAPNGRYAADISSLSAAKPKQTFGLTATAGVYSYGSSMPASIWKDSNYYADLVFSKSLSVLPTQPSAGSSQTTSNSVSTGSSRPTTTAAVSTAPTTSNSTTVRPSTTTSTSSSTASAGVPPRSTFPSETNTGVPAGTSLSGYTGPCTITTPNTVIDAKTVNCGLTIRASGVKITRSRINGTVATDENSTGYSFAISDSEVNVGQNPSTGIGSVDFTALRVHVTGGNRSIHCYRACTVQDSYVHGQFADYSGVYHESGIRMGQSAVIRHNTITCDAPNIPPDAGCSADLTGYGDFAPVQNNLIEGNLFLAGTGGYCAYGGSTGGKPYSSSTNNIVFRNNIWEVGSNPSRPSCYYGPITSFDSNAPGNRWENNLFDNGKVVAPAN